jgi:hypothetical protein
MKKKHTFFIVILVIGLFFAWILYNIFREWKCCDFSDFNKGNEIIRKIEAFKKSTGKLPDKLEDIGENIKDESPIFYEKIDTDKYEIWFGTTLGSSCVYKSETGKWTPTPVG